MARRSSLSIQPFEGSRFVRGGRYGISIDFGLEVVENQSVCGMTFESEFIELTKKLNEQVKTLSPSHRLVIALHSPDGVVKTGLPMCPPEKKARKLDWGVRQDTFSSPV